MGRSSVGGKGSGRRSGEVGWGEEGTRKITTERIVKEKGTHPVIKKLDKALEEIDDLDVTDFFQIVFDSGADAILICRVVPNGEEFKVGTLKKGMPYPNEDVETFLLNSFGGPGTFLLKPAIKSPYGGLLRVSKNKRVRIGVSSESDAGLMGGLSGDADSMITRVLAREDKMHALNKIRELNDKASGSNKGGGDEMKADELLTIVRELKGNDKTSEILLEMLRNERQERAAMLAAAQQKNPLELLGPVLTPLLGFLDKKLSPATVGKWIDVLRNPVPSEPAETGIVGTVAGLLKDYMPMLQPYIASALQSMVTPGAPGAPRHLATVPPAVAAAPPTTTQTEDEMATREYDDADTKEVLDYVVTCLDSHKFPEAYAALRTCDDTVDAIAPIMPGSEPMAFYFRVRDLDIRLRERKDTVLEFIAYIQKQIEDYMKAQQAAQHGGEQAPPATAPPAA
jgi:hypothetical protein